MIKSLPMTRSRLTALIVGVPVAMATIGWIAVCEVADASQGSFAVRMATAANGRPVSVAIDSGTLRVGQATGGGIRLTGTARYSLVRSTVTWHITSSAITSESHCHFSVPVCSFTYQISVPATVPVSLTDASGDITATGLANSRVLVEDASGNVIITFSAVPDLVQITDQLGDVTLVLPPGPTAYRVNAQASLGTASVHVPTSQSSAHVITVTNGSGNIMISTGSG
jgi:hypothetical protein